MPQFGAGGFRRLSEKGAYFPECRHLASTFSATGIATLATGAWPAQHGVVADSWYDRASRQVVRASEDALMATTLAAQITAEPRTRAYVVALDRAHAALYSGCPSAQLFWMDDHGQFTSDFPPEWLPAYRKLASVSNAHNAEWMAVGARPGAPPLRKLTYNPANPSEFLLLYKASPFSEDAQFRFVAELIAQERLGRRQTFDFVCLLAGSSALLGYETGGRSPLMEQMTLRLDQHLEFLLKTLDVTPGENNYTVVLAAAHGSPPAPDPINRSRMAVNGESLAETLNHSLIVDGRGKVEKYVYPFLYLNTNGSADPEAVRAVAGAAALRQPAVADYYTAGGACSTRDVWQRRFRNSFHLKRCGDVMLSYRPEYVEEYGSGRGVSYGSLYNYDALVPLCFYGPQFTAGVFEKPVDSVDVAPTMARAIGVSQPSSTPGRVLSEAFGE